MKEKSKGIVAEFKEFITRGNVIDLAVGIIVGSSFTAIVNSLVADIVMPFIGWIVGDMDFSNLKLILVKATEAKPEVAIRYGLFMQKSLEFLIIAFVVFLVVKLINRLRRTLKNGILPFHEHDSNEQQQSANEQAK